MTNKINTIKVWNTIVQFRQELWKPIEIINNNGKFSTISEEVQLNTLKMFYWKHIVL